MSVRKPLINDPRRLAAQNLFDSITESQERMKQIRAFTDKQLAQELLEKVWAKTKIYTEQFDLLEEAHQRLKSAQHRVQRTAIAAFIIGGFVFLGIRWLVFGG